MINKQKLWFLTLFSLILVLSIYYITMPKEVFESKKENEVNKENDNKVNIEISDSSSLDVLRVSDDEARLKEIEDLRIVLTNVDSSIDEKNKAYEKLKLIEQNKGKEESLEDKIKNEIIFTLHKENDKWILDDISDSDRQKLHGLYGG